MCPPSSSFRRVLITGVGCCTPLGHSLDDMARALRAEVSPFVPSTVLPGYSVSPVSFDAAARPQPQQDAALRTLLGWRHRHYCQRGGQLAVLAALRAAADATDAAATAATADAPQQLLPHDTPIVAALGPMLDMTGEPGLPPGNTDALGALWLLRWLPNTPVAAAAQLLGLHGEGLTVNAACASALQALGEGFRRIRCGLNTRVLVMAGDSRLSLGGLLGYAKAQALSRRGGTEGPRPFDASRDGFVAAEGGAAFVLEDAQSAAARGARWYAEILGYGASLDAGSLTAPDPQGRQARQAVLTALAQSGLDRPHWISAHGTGTRLNDAAESALLEQLFPRQPLPAVMACKSLLGHGSAAAGALELCCVLAGWQNGLMPRIRGLEQPCSPQLRFVRQACPFPGPDGLLENFGFGGQNAALVVRLCPR